VAEHVAGLRVAVSAVTLALLDAVLDGWLAVRVAAHRARGGADAKTRAIDVPLYLHALRVVRLVEELLEPERRRLGARESRAFYLSTQNEQLALAVA
jgi:hypothetical protein